MTTTPPDRIKCPTCEGRRFLDIDTRAIHAGARCGKDITLRFQCETCKGTGKVAVLLHPLMPVAMAEVR